MLPTLDEAIKFFIDYGNVHGTLESCLKQWPPSFSQLRNAADQAKRKGRSNHEIDKMVAAIVFGKK